MPRARVETKEMQYLYNDGNLYYFMDNDTFEQIPLNYSQVEEAVQFVKENSSVNIRFFKGEAFSVEAPNFVDLEVTETEPGFKGDTASNTYKPATVETGFSLMVPLFINIGDVIKIDTRTGEYLSRV
jgi:elongation factor P